MWIFILIFPGGGVSFDEIPGGTVSENGHSQLGSTDYFWKSPFLKFFLYVMNDVTKVVNVGYFSLKRH